MYPLLLSHVCVCFQFAEWCLDYGTHGCRIPDRPYSLFEGKLCVCLSIMHITRRFCFKPLTLNIRPLKREWGEMIAYNY